MLVLDWLRMAMVELFIWTRFWPSRMLVEDCAKAAAIPGVRSTNSEGSATFEIKLKPEISADCSAGCEVSTPVSITATVIPVPVKPEAACKSCWRMMAVAGCVT